MSGCKAKWLTFGKSRVRVRGKSTSFPHFAYILSLAPFNWKSRDSARYNDVITNGKKSTIYKSHAWPVLCTALQKHGPDWKAKYERGFCNRDVPDFGHHFSYKRYVFSIVSSSEMITMQFCNNKLSFLRSRTNGGFFARSALRHWKKGWFKHSCKSKLQL